MAVKSGVPKRKIDGLTYSQYSTHKTKKLAQENAVQLRQRNINARVIPINRVVEGRSEIVGYQVWTSRPKSWYDAMMKRADVRAYNSHARGHKSVLVYADEIQRRGRVKATGKRNWLGFRKRTKTDRLNQIEAEDYLKTQDLLVKTTGKTEEEATVEALKFAKANRLAREKKDEDDQKAKLQDIQIAIAKEDVRLKQFQDDKDRYESDIPTSELLRYNSLEIAGVGTGGLAGYGIASAFSVSAFPAIPIGLAVGLVGAKAVRGNWGNVGLKPGVNSVIDLVEDSTKSVAQSLRVSKDNETYESSNLWTVGRGRAAVEIPLVRRPGRRPLPKDKKNSQKRIKNLNKLDRLRKKPKKTKLDVRRIKRLEKKTAP